MIPFLIWGSTSAQESSDDDSGLLSTQQTQAKVSEIEEKVDAQILSVERHIAELDLLICALERMEADARLPAPLVTDPRPPLRPLPLPLPRPRPPG